MSEINESTENNRLKIQTGIDPNFLSATLTEDIQLTDAIFDLFDNSIDAARNQITNDAKQKTLKDEFGLPSNYSGYEITLTLDTDAIAAADNCMGFDKEALKNEALYIGRRSDHPFGIGNYGVGLKRALMKAGEEINVTTENSHNRCEINFNVRAFGNDSDEAIYAIPIKKTGNLGTTLTVKSLRAGIEHQLKDQEWYNNFIKEISIRYSIFIKKGLKISVINNHLNQTNLCITPSLPDIRDEEPLPVSTTTIPNINGVNTYIKTGVHGDYRFKGELGHNQTVNTRISNEFGIYFICNDRVIVAHSTEEKHGFTTQWHNEYAGFACIVRMVADSPSQLPWNTAKTELQTSGSFFLHIRKHIEPLAKDYRAKAKKIIKAWNNPSIRGLADSERKRRFREELGLPAIPKKPISQFTTRNSNSTQNRNPEDDKNRKTNGNSNVTGNHNNGEAKSHPPSSSTKKLISSDSHSNKLNTILPNDFPQPSNSQNLNNMIVEAHNMNFTESPHAASMLYRAILEGSSRHYASKTGNFNAVKDHFYSKGEGKGKNHSDEYKKAQGIDLTMTLKWLNDNTNLFPDPDRKTLKLCLKSVLSDNQKLNGIVHCKSITNEAEFRIIRDKSLELVRFFITEAETKGK